MPIIGYIHSRKVYRVARARTVEWSFAQYGRDEVRNIYAPFLGVTESGEYDCAEFFEFPMENEKEAMEKMAELWAEWQKVGFTGVFHA